MSKVKHLAVIMDGNRRWAKARNLPSIAGHKQGVEALKNLVKLASKYQIEIITAYAFSTENWKRDETEIDFLFKLLAEVALSEAQNLNKQNIRVSFIGDLSVFANQSLEKSIKNLVSSTQNNTGLKLQVALNYGSIAEITQALNRIKNELSKEEINKLNIDDFASYLYTSACPDPELVIRTGGVQRLSNYLLWQSNKAHLYFSPTLWPDFCAKDLEHALNEYKGALV